MSYTYRERDREWDDYSRPSDRSYKVKRYVVSHDDNRERERDFFRREDSGTADRELVIRRRTEPYETDYEVRREYRTERDYEPRSIHEPEYQVVHRSEASERDPRDVEYYYQRRVREYDDDRERVRRELSPHDSVSQVGSRRHRDRDRDRDYSSDDSMVYIRKETREYDGEPHHHKRHLAEGALLGVGAMELLRHRSKSQGRPVSGALGHVGQGVGAAALGAVAANAIEHYRSKSRRRSSSVDDDRSSRHYHHGHRSGHRSRSRSRSSSHSRAKTLAGIGLGAAAIAGAVALARQKSQSNKDRRSRSRHRRSSQSRGDDVRSTSKSRNQHIAAAGLAGAAAAGIIEKVRSRSRSRKGEHRSRSRLRQSLPIVAAGLGSAAVAGLYENRKAKKEQDGASERQLSRSRSRGRGAILPDPGKESTSLIEYGQDPVYGNIPAADYYGRPISSQGYYPDAVVPAGTSRNRSQSRGYSPSDTDSDRSHRRRHRRREKKERSGSRIRDFAEAGLAAAGLGYAASKISGGKKDRKDREHRSHSRERRGRRDNDGDHDSYEEPYDPAPYIPSPPPAGPAPAVDNYYPYTNSFPPPPGVTPNPPPMSYPAAEYPPPGTTSAPPPQGYPPPPGPPPTNEPYAPQPRRADENVSAPFLDAHHRPDGLMGDGSSRRRSVSRPESPPQQKSVSFDLNDQERSNMKARIPSDETAEKGYETDDSDSTIDGLDHGRYSHHHRPRHPSAPYGRTSAVPNNASSTHNGNANPPPKPHPLNVARDSDSESTIELPDRFDTEGRRLPEKGDDPLADRVDDLLRNVFSNDNARPRPTSRVR
ncbi:hypothetical protein BGW36DRAFT_179272 [Talaromyces proteolyticus]|uniref:DUF3824 domain-containing protein n=1 Tax=Talaromyces proteolyticus TaxID=1131652 RepID=A0AAD4KMA3_9EURO|nr:uncharacterized protein BGW36DRAFT_179272 [Talaromyces proteolyticus]KAH8695968.1 hypothetical protein BGW36DRAFT_179272 [Talaromyces proteolyticus]